MFLPGKKESLILLLGDLFFFALALALALSVRFGVWVSSDLFFVHLRAFWVLFLLWALVFFISDLYHKRAFVFGSAIPPRILEAQVVNSLIAVVFFYFVPGFNLTPKTILFIDLVFTFGLVWLWRRFLAPFIYRPPRDRILFACAGPAVEELKRELKNNPKYNLEVVTSQPSVVVFNTGDYAKNGAVADFFRLFFRGVVFLDVEQLYEDVFERVPLSLIGEQWFIEQVSNRPRRGYDFFKRLADVVLSLILGLVALVFFPIIALAIKLDDGGPVFYREARVGRLGRKFLITKFRSMTTDLELGARRPTRVGRWLRRSRLDELPQLLSVLRGEQSLIGPRPERPEYAELYRRDIKYYDVRHLIKPGLSGWAQLRQDNHPHFKPQLEATGEKLAYDLFYLKNRGWWLDLEIALKTLKTLVSIRGV